MACLPAIEPQRGAGVGNRETVLRDHRCVGGNRLEVGVNARGWGGQRGARVVKARLGNSVVPGQELERDNIPFICGNTVRCEGQGPVLSDHDIDSVGVDTSSKTQESGNGRETHVSDR